MKRGSSTRLTGEPRTSWTSVAIGVSFGALSARWSGGGGGRRRRAGPHRHGRFADRGDDVVVARAAADVAFDRVADLVVRWIGVAGEEVGRGHDHSRSAEAALEAVLLPEGLLERVERAVARLHPLDRRQPGAVGLDGEHRAALHRLAVEVDRARAALAGVAADVRSRQLEILPQELDKQPS